MLASGVVLSSKSRKGPLMAQVKGGSGDSDGIDGDVVFQVFYSMLVEGVIGVVSTGARKLPGRRRGRPT